MRQLQLPRALSAGEWVELSGDEYHYLSRVLRSKPGASVPVLDAAGNRWTFVIQADDGTRLSGRVEQASAPGSPDATTVSGGPAARPGLEFPSVTLYQAIPKGRKLDEAIRQLVQAGVDQIRPVITERTIVRPDAGGTRTDRWQRIAREAVQQSGARRPVTVFEPSPLADVRPAAGALALVLHPQPLAQSTLHGYLADIPSTIEIVVGPEGGLSDTELASLLERGYRPVWLGPQVLRSETAALFAVAALRILILERPNWQPVE